MKYIEFSSLTGQNLKMVFEEAVKAAFLPKPKKGKKKKGGCVIM